jgi:hypothetical protein
VSALTVVVVRDPDGPTLIQVFDGDVEVEHGEVVVDAGAGHSWDDWQARRDEDLAAAGKVGPSLLQAVRDAYDGPPGGEDGIWDKEFDEPWLPG